MPTQVFDALARVRLMPAVRIGDSAHAVPVAQALAAAGLPVIEVTLRTPEALEAVRTIRAACPNLLVGVGTVIAPAMVMAARAAGAQFGVSPGWQPAVAIAAQEAGWPFIPGVATPGEIEQALAHGCLWQKLFPADVLGGRRYLDALGGPYAHTGLRLVALGGIHVGNLREYLDHPLIGAVGGSWMTPGPAMGAGDWTGIGRLAAEALAIAHSTGIHT